MRGRTESLGSMIGCREDEVEWGEEMGEDSLGSRWSIAQDPRLPAWNTLEEPSHLWGQQLGPLSLFPPFLLHLQEQNTYSQWDHLHSLEPAASSSETLQLLPVPVTHSGECPGQSQESYSPVLTPTTSQP